MKENTIDISHIDQTELFGVRESKLKLIRSFYPKLKIIVRGGIVKVMGDSKSIKKFNNGLELLLSHLDKYNTDINDICLHQLEGENILEEVKSNAKHQKRKFAKLKENSFQAYEFFCVYA